MDGDLVSLLGWSTLLNDQQIQVLAATDEDEALSAFGQKEIAVVVLTTAVNDHGAVVHRMKSLKPEVPVILFLPAQADGLHGVDTFVRESSELLATVVQYLGKPH